MNGTTKARILNRSRIRPVSWKRSLISPFIDKTFVRDDCFKVEHRGGGVETVPWTHIRETGVDRFWEYPLEAATFNTRDALPFTGFAVLNCNRKMTIQLINEQMMAMQKTALQY